MWDKIDRALNGADDESVFPSMSLVPGWIKVTAIPLPDNDPGEKVETIRKCVEMVHNAITISSIVLLVEQVDSSIVDDREKIVALNGALMTTEDALTELFPTLLVIKPISPVQGCQPDISFVFQWTNVAEQLRTLGLWAYLANHIPEPIGPLQSISRTAHMPRQRSRFGNSSLTTPRNATRRA